MKVEANPAKVTRRPSIFHPDISLNSLEDPERIHLSELPEYIDMLLQDDVDKFKAMSPEWRKKFHCGQFEYKPMKPDEECTNEEQQNVEDFEIPFNIAVGYCATKIIKEYLYQGIDVTRLDIGGANVLHVLSACTAERYRPEADYVNTCKLLVEDHLTEDQFRCLCHQENSDGLRPLELAAKLGAFGIFRTLLLEPGYICGQGMPNGMSMICRYDVSEYEDSRDHRRLVRAPLRYMVHVSKAGLESMLYYKIMALPIMRKWIKMKIRQDIGFLILWWIMRMAFIAFVCFLDPNIAVYEQMCGGYKPPKQRPSKKADLAGATRFQQCRKMAKITPELRDLMRDAVDFAWYWSLLMLTFDAIEMLYTLCHNDRRRAYRKTAAMRGDFAIYTPSYRIAQFLLYLINVISIPLARSMPGGEASRMLLNVKAAQLPLCLMSFLYIVEFLPVIGIFAITLQGMLKSMIIFMVFLLPVKICFSMFFKWFDDTGLFAQIREGIYHLFLLDMGSLDFGANPRVLIQVVHVFYFMVMLILLFNYLIAVLSIVADEVRNYEQIFVDLRRLQMLHLIEERFTFWMWKLLYMFLMKRKPIVLYAIKPLTEKEEK